MADTNPTILVCHPAVRDVIDGDAFAAAFPGVTLSFVDYQIPHEQLVIRSDQPSAAAPEELTPDQLAAFASADILVALNAPLDLARVAPRVRWIQAVGSGIGQFVASGVEGVTVTNTAGVAAVPIAEWVLAQTLAMYKKLPTYLDQQRAHVWSSVGGSMLMGRRALIVGAGAIGVEVARRLGAFGVHVTGVRRRVVPGAPLPDGMADLIPVERLGEAVPVSDIVVACVPGTPATEDMFDRSFFDSMQPGSVFVNVGRGASVDEQALIDVLSTGHLRAAAIDVARREPLPVDDLLWDAPNLSITPHSSSSGGRFFPGVWDLFCENLERYLDGRPLRNVVDVHAEYAR